MSVHPHYRLVTTDCCFYSAEQMHLLQLLTHSSLSEVVRFGRCTSCTPSCAAQRCSFNLHYRHSAVAKCNSIKYYVMRTRYTILCSKSSCCIVAGGSATIRPARYPSGIDVHGRKPSQPANDSTSSHVAACPPPDLQGRGPTPVSVMFLLLLIHGCWRPQIPGTCQGVLLTRRRQSQSFSHYFTLTVLPLADLLTAFPLRLLRTDCRLLSTTLSDLCLLSPASYMTLDNSDNTC